MEFNINLKQLYILNGAYLSHGGYIDFYDEDGIKEPYDLRTDDPDDQCSELIAHNNDRCKVLNEHWMDGEIVELECTQTLRKFYLTTKEFNLIKTNQN